MTVHCVVCDSSLVFYLKILLSSRYCCHLSPPPRWADEQPCSVRKRPCDREGERSINTGPDPVKEQNSLITQPTAKPHSPPSTYTSPGVPQSILQELWEERDKPPERSPRTFNMSDAFKPCFRVLTHLPSTSWKSSQCLSTIPKEPRNKPRMCQPKNIKGTYQV